MAAIAAEITDAMCDVEIIEFSPRALLGPLVLRTWKENQSKGGRLDDGRKMKVSHFFG